MKDILLLNKIAKVGCDQLDCALYNVGEDVADPDGIMVRSAAMHDMEFGAKLEAIARAGAGVNNIPVEKCTEQGIVVFNTPGANANGVKELAICALLLAARNITGGIRWAAGLSQEDDVAKKVEKGKSAFAGTELLGKTLGVIGLGAIGGLVANEALKMGCDPFLSVNAAWKLDRHVTHASTFDEVYEKADYITLHVPSTKDTKGMICADTFAKMKDGVKIINLARADLVNVPDMKAALDSGKVSAYVTDFPTNETLTDDRIIAIPHLGASTEEAEDNCAVMAARQLDDFLQNGNIVNSVNFPSVSMPRSSEARVCVFHDNVPAVISNITAEMGKRGINIENMTNKSKGNAAYTMLDIATAPDDETVEAVAAIDGVIRVKVI